MKPIFLTFAALFVLLVYCPAQEAIAPPKNPDTARTADLVELTDLDKSIKLDVRYATADNFVGKPVYPEPRAFLQKPAAEALVRVHQRLKKQGLGLVLFDGYRPWAVTKLFWEVTPEDKRKFVANPKTGSRHNRGCAIDLGLFDVKTGKNIEMPSEFDEFTERASPDYKGGTESQTKMRDFLRREMEAEGFTVNSNEWWHFDYKDWKEYGIYDISFAAVRDLDADFRRAKIEEKTGWKKYFEAAGVTGAIAVYDLQANKFLVFDRERLDKGFVPASTSKIIHSLIFLESGALRDENEILKWDGVARRVAAWNQDHNLRTAFKTSAVWFYVEASKRVGRDAMRHYYDLADYGNQNTDGFGDAYWVKGNLRLTMREQILFLKRFYENRLPFSAETLDAVKDFSIFEQTDKYTIRAKTGWSDAYTPNVGWFVGYVERGADVYFFAAQVDIRKDADAPKRAEIAKSVFRELKIIE